MEADGCVSVQRMINTRRVPVWVRLPVLVLDKVYAEHSGFFFFLKFFKVVRGNSWRACSSVGNSEGVG